MIKFEAIVQTKYPPRTTNVLWLYEKSLKYFNNGEWVDINNSGIDSAVIEDIQDKIEKGLTGVYKFQGSVNDFDDLPTEGLKAGDTYNVLATDMNYAWVEDDNDPNGGHWDSLGGSFFDPSPIIEGVEGIDERLVTVENNYKKRPNGDIDSEGCERHLLYIGDTSSDIQPMNDTNKDWILIFKNFSCNSGSIFEELRVILGFYKLHGTQPSTFPVADYFITIMGTARSMGAPRVFIRNKFIKPNGYKQFIHGSFTNEDWDLKPEDIMLVENRNTHSSKGESRTYDLYIKNNVQYAYYQIYEMRRPVRDSSVFTYWCTNRLGISAPYTNVANGINADNYYERRVPIEKWCATTDDAHPASSRREVLCKDTFNTSEISGTKYYGEFADEAEGIDMSIYQLKDDPDIQIIDDIAGKTKVVNAINQTNDNTWDNYSRPDCLKDRIVGSEFDAATQLLGEGWTTITNSFAAELYNYVTNNIEDQSKVKLWIEDDRLNLPKSIRNKHPNVVGLGLYQGLYEGIELISTDGTDSVFFNFNDSDNEMIYYQVGYVYITGYYSYKLNCSIRFTFFPGSDEMLQRVDNDRCGGNVIRPISLTQGVDIGLSYKIAKYNLGQNDYSLNLVRFAYGELVPKTEFTWDNYMCSRKECGTAADPLKGTDYQILHKLNEDKHISSLERTAWNNKQDKLTAGAGISIDSSNTISCTVASGSNDSFKSCNIETPPDYINSSFRYTKIGKFTTPSENNPIVVEMFYNDGTSGTITLKSNLQNSVVYSPAVVYNGTQFNLQNTFKIIIDNNENYLCIDNTVAPQASGTIFKFATHDDRIELTGLHGGIQDTFPSDTSNTTYNLPNACSFLNIGTGDHTYGISVPKSDIKVVTTHQGNHTDFAIELQPAQALEYDINGNERWYSLQDIVTALFNNNILY